MEANAIRSRTRSSSLRRLDYEEFSWFFLPASIAAMSLLVVLGLL